jgi:hypothetical protein
MLAEFGGSLSGSRSIRQWAFTACLGGWVRFRVLGPLAVCGDDGNPVEIRQAMQRTPLSPLLLQAKQPLSGDWLVEALWGGRSDGRSTRRSNRRPPSSGTGGHRPRTHGEANMLANLAEVALRRPAWTEAVERRGRSIARSRQLGDRATEAWALGIRGEARRRRALVIFQQLGAPQAADARRLLDDAGGERP